MKYTWAAPTVEGDAVVHRITATMEIHEIRGHPDRFLPDVGDVYRGIPIVRDATIPMNEIHIIEGNRRMVMRYNEMPI